MNRREVIIRVGELVLILPAAAFLKACGSSSTTTDQNNPNAGLTVVSSTSGTHTHTFTITSAQLTSPPTAGITGDDSTSDGHNHTVTLTKAELTQINNGEEVVSPTSTVNSHSHTYIFKKSA